jgi:hypothetical protein
MRDNLGDLRASAKARGVVFSFYTTVRAFALTLDRQDWGASFDYGSLREPSLRMT